MSIFSKTILHTDHSWDYLQPFILQLLPHWHSDMYAAKVVAKSKLQRNFLGLELKLDNYLNLIRGKKFKFLPGQHIELALRVDGICYRRFFSICSAPNYLAASGNIKLAIEVKKTGFISRWLQQNLSVGNWLSISDAKGKMVLPSCARPLLILAAGSGITPFKSMLDQLAASAKQRRISLVYSARDRHLFAADFAHLARQLPNLELLLHNSCTDGRIDAALIANSCTDLWQRRVLICGGAGFVNQCQAMLAQLGLSKRQLTYEMFSANLSAPKNVNSSSFLAQIVLLKSGRVLQAEHQTQSILELALKNNIQLRHGCKMGICKECQCYKKSGKVYNVLDNYYSTTSPQQIRLCISRPIGKVVLDA